MEKFENELQSFLECRLAIKGNALYVEMLTRHLLGFNTHRECRNQFSKKQHRSNEDNAD